MPLREVIYMLKIKFNYFFFIMAFVLPLGVGTIATLIWWPAIHSHYWEVIMSPTTNIIIGYALMFAFMWFIVSYMAMPWLVVIREDRITFHRLFRRKLEIRYEDIEKVEFLCNHMPIENYKYGLGHLLFYRKTQERIFVGGVPHGAVIEMRERLRRVGIEVDVSTRNLTKEEIKDLQDGKIKK